MQTKTQRMNYCLRIKNIRWKKANVLYKKIQIFKRIMKKNQEENI